MNEFGQPYKKLNQGHAPINWNVKFGKNVVLGENVVIDEDCIIGDNVFIGHNTVIRSGVTLNANVTIGHLVMVEADTEIGKYTTIQSQCHITKFAYIGEHCFFGPKAMCINTNKISHGRDFKPNLNGPYFGFGCRVGSGAVIMPGISLGREVEIGANSTVTKDCKDFGVYIGSPAKWVREVPKGERYS